MPTISLDRPETLIATREAPWGAPGGAFRPTSPAAARRRAEAVAKLLVAVKALVEAAHQAMFEGSLGPDEYAHLADLQAWLGALLAEQESAGKQPRAKKPRRK